MMSLAFLGSVGMQELVVIFLIVLVLFGPKALPKLARSLGSSIREFKDATTKMTETVMKDEDEEANRRRPEPESIEGSVSRPSVRKAEADKVAPRSANS